MTIKTSRIPRAGNRVLAAVAAEMGAVPMVSLKKPDQRHRSANKVRGSKEREAADRPRYAVCSRLNKGCRVRRRVPLVF